METQSAGKQNTV